MMPQSTRRITNPMENVDWFSSQFELHVAHSHPEIAARKKSWGNARKSLD
jgi:hypothetical protein